MLTVTLPWPDARLSGNSRINYQARARLARAARWEAKILTDQVIGAQPLPFTRADHLRVTAIYHPPDRRARDLFDNLPSATKPMIDGVFDALAVDDSQVRQVETRMGEVCQPPIVMIRVERLIGYSETDP